MPQIRNSRSTRASRSLLGSRRIHQAVIESLEVRQLLAHSASLTPVIVSPGPIISSGHGAEPTTPVGGSITFGTPSQVTAGDSFDFSTSTSDDDSGPYEYGGDLHFSSSDPLGSFPSDVNPGSDYGSWSGVFRTAGQQSISATNDDGAQGTSDPVTVVAAPATHFSISGQPNTTFGSEENVTVAAEDQFGNIDTSFNDATTFTTSDPNANFPTTLEFNQGIATLSGYFISAGHQTMQASDASNSDINGVSNAVTVSSFPLLVNDASGQLDSVFDRSHLTLPDAVFLANIQTDFNTITFSPTAFPANTQTEIDIDQPLEISQVQAKVTISGLGSNRILLASTNSNSLFTIDEDSIAEIDGLSMTAQTDHFEGGAIYNDGNLTLVNDAIFGSNAAEGGAIYSDEGSTLSILSGSITNNSAGAYGGGIYGYQNHTTLDGVTVSGNVALGELSEAELSPSVEGYGQGGGIYQRGGTLTIEDGSLIGGSNEGQGNSAAVGGGVAMIVSDFNSTAHLIITDSTIQGNESNQGGGLYAYNFGGDSTLSVDITGSTIDSNTAEQASGGGLSLGASGGDDTNAITNATIIDSTISNNSAQSNGGGVYAYGAGSSTLALVIQNSTISGNSVGRSGGGINMYGYGDGEDGYTASSLTLEHDTIANNIANIDNTEAGGGGVHSDLYGNPAEVDSSILSGNFSGPDHFPDDFLGDYNGDNNLIGGNALLAPLGDYGGPTQTMALLPGSPAIDGAENRGGLDTDQRGIDRPQGFASDIGAFESQGFNISIIGGDQQSTQINTNFAQELFVSVTSNDSISDLSGGQITFTSLDDGVDGAAAVFLSDSPAFIGEGNEAFVVVAANGEAGTYNVSASADNFDSVPEFTLTNTDITPVFSGFSVSLPESATAGDATDFTVTAIDQLGNIFEGYSGTVHFTSTDPNAILPDDAVLNDGTGNFVAVFTTAGDQTLTATDTITEATGSSDTQVFAGATSSFDIELPSFTTAGQSFQFTVQAVDQFGNATDFDSNDLVFSSSDPQAVLPTSTEIDGGFGTYSITLDTAGEQTISVSGTQIEAGVAPLISFIGPSGTSEPIFVQAATADHLVITAPDGATAGQQFEFTVDAEDPYGNVTDDYGGELHFTSTDPLATLPDDSSFNAEGTFDATLKTAGSWTITADDTVNGLSGISGSIFVSAAAATHFVVSAPSPTPAGSSFDLSISAEDPYGNIVSDYGGSLQFSSTDGQAVLPINATVTTNGTFQFSATLKTSGLQTISVTDSADGLTGISNQILVTAGAATHFVLSTPAGAIAGSPFNFTVTAEDQFNNVADGYLGTVAFVSSDGKALLPSSLHLTNGIATLSATLFTVGGQTITASDTVNNSIASGVSDSIMVAAAAANHFVISASGSATAGVAFNFNVTAEDPFGNFATAYTGPVHFSANDPLATLPDDAMLVNGAGIFSATLDLAGGRVISANDVANTAVVGSSNLITVAAAQASHFVISTPKTATAGTQFIFGITAIDAFGNTANGYTGTVQFTSNDSQAILPANTTLIGGVGSFQATLKSAGPRQISAVDSVNGLLSGISNTINVAGLAASQFVLSTPPTAINGTPFTFTVTAEDPFNNVATTYNGLLHFTSNDPLAALPANTNLTNGFGTFSATLKTAGSKIITATDTVTSTLVGSSDPIIVNGTTVIFPLLVNDTADRLDASIDPLHLTLRDAVSLANSRTTADTINFDTTVFAPGSAHTITLTLGALELSDTAGKTTIIGPGARVLTISGNSVSGIFQVDFGVTAELENLTLTLGAAGISHQGGAVLNHGNLTIDRSTISSSLALNEPAGNGMGGGVYSDGALTMLACTITGNQADEGGGIFNAGTASITGCTIYNNSGLTQGGAIESAGTLTMWSSTLNANTAGVGAGILIDTGDVTVYNSILVGNTKTGTSGTPTNLGGTLDAALAPGQTPSSNNIFGSLVAGIINGVNGNQVAVANAGLGTFGNYGGPTDTIPLLPGSVAINAGKNSLLPAGLVTDQNGNTRIAGTTVDIGAIEVQPVISTTLLSAPVGPYQTGVPITLTATVTVPAGSAAPVGNVSFFDGTTLLSTVALFGNTASITITFTSIATHPITATFQTDGVHLGSTTTLNLNVVKGFTAPTAKADTATTTPDATVTINVLGNDTDPNSSPLTISAINANPLDGIAAIVNGKITYKPITGFHGTDTFIYQITDGHGLSATASVTVTVGAGIGVGTDPDATSQTDLDIVGPTTGNNTIVVTHGAAQGTVSVSINNVSKGTFNFTGRILVFGGSGNDTITIDSAITRTAIIHGGAGNDIINGGAGNDILFGDAGNDSINGNSGRDIIIGGLNNDTVNGGSGDDLLIGGTTSYDTVFASIDAIWTEWNLVTPSATYAVRTAAIRNGVGPAGSVKLTNATVFSEATSTDTFTGGTNQDFYFDDLTKTKVDVITDLVTTGTTPETVVAVHS